ncbi:MAG: amino-acid racemase [Clostridiales bacterium]|jgi:D-serine deaminase-like pyridoxal phosphate-dependent protein|nr:amino-acid racemase [Clostridiales bacterium]
MYLCDLATPYVALDLDVLTRNIARMQKLADTHGCGLWPMLKTHKSLAIARQQKLAGAAGFLCGTLDEAEGAASLGLPLMLAYPVIHPAALERVRAVSERVTLYAAVDSDDAAKALAKAVPGCRVLMILDAGLHRFGVSPDALPELAANCTALGLRVCGMGTHAGQVYAAAPETVRQVAEEERTVISRAVDMLTAAGYPPEIVAAGSTPTCPYEAASGIVTALRPGNYVFHDAAQAALGSAELHDCALTVAATVIRKDGGRVIIDAGSKLLTLDRGAHGSSLLTGCGHVLHCDAITVAGLSEQVGTLTGADRLKVGDQVRIIPNHACAVANQTSWYAASRAGVFEGWIPVDWRDGVKKPAPPTALKSDTL